MIKRGRGHTRASATAASTSVPVLRTLMALTEAEIRAWWDSRSEKKGKTLFIKSFSHRNCNSKYFSNEHSSGEKKQQNEALTFDPALFKWLKCNLMRLTKHRLSSPLQRTQRGGGASREGAGPYSPSGEKPRAGLVSRLLSRLVSRLQPWLALGRGIRLRAAESGRRRRGQEGRTASMQWVTGLDMLDRRRTACRNRTPQLPLLVRLEKEACWLGGMVELLRATFYSIRLSSSTATT